MSLLLLLRPPGAPTSPVRTATLTVVPRITAGISLDPLGGALVPSVTGIFVPNATHRITVSGVATMSGSLVDNTSTYCKVQITDADTGSVYYGLTPMTYDSPGQWHGDVPASSGAWPVGAAMTVTVEVLDLLSSTLQRSVSQTRYPAPPVLLRAAAQSANRLSITAVSDLGTLQNDTNTACALFMSDGTGAVILNGAGMGYAGGNTWTYDLPQGMLPYGAVLTVTGAIYDQTVATRRGSVYGWALVA